MLAAAEGIYAGVLEETPDYAPYGDVLRLPFDPGNEAAYAPDYEVDFNAGLASLYELIYDGLIRKAVHLCGYAGLPALLCRGNLAIDLLYYALFQSGGRDEQSLIVAVEIAYGYVAEEERGVLARLSVRRDYVEVGILLAGRLVIVARAEMGDIAELVVFGEHDGDYLGVHFIVLHSVDYRTACLLQYACGVEVVLLVESGAQLYDDSDRLAVFASPLERFYYPRPVCQSVYGYPYGDYPVVLGALVEEAQNGRHAVVWIGQIHVARFYEFYH